MTDSNLHPVFKNILDSQLNTKRYKIQGKLLTTGSKKWFEFDNDEWAMFIKNRYTHYPAWTFNDSTIVPV